MSIDHDVARKVMGWKRRLYNEVWEIKRGHPDYDDQKGKFDNHWWWRGKEMAYVEDEGCCREDYEYGFAPSKKIADAWKVVEEISAPEDRNFNIGRRSYPNGEWCASFHWRDGRPPVYGRADTAPMAICLAALSALSAPREEAP